MKIFSAKILLFLFIALAFFGVQPAFASSTAGTIDLADKYAWTENAGWLDFGTSQGNIGVSDSGLTGYAWGENTGWISLSCSNDNTCGAVEYRVANDGNGGLSGYGWAENIGWIDFNPAYGGVSINSSGEFSGYAWNENAGWIVFNCATTNSCASVDYKIKTDWRPRTARPDCNNASDDDGDGKTDHPADPGCSSPDDTDETDSGGSGLPPAAFSPPVLPEANADFPDGFGIMINSGEEHTSSPAVTLRLRGGSDASEMAISNSPDFSRTAKEKYSETRKWQLAEGEGKKTVYAIFYTRWGQPTDIISASITLGSKPEAEKEALKPLLDETREVAADSKEEDKNSFAKKTYPKVKPPKKSPEKSQPKEKPVVKKEKESPAENFTDKIKDWIPEFLRPKADDRAPELPKKNQGDPKTPLAAPGDNAFLGDNSAETAGGYSLAELRDLLSKFPEVGKILTEKGIGEMSDLARSSINFSLPALNRILDIGKAEVKTVRLKLAKNIPLISLSAEMKNKLPAETILARSKGETIDIPLKISIDKQGKIEQKINVISGKTLNLSIKPEKEARKVMGYFTLKTRNSALDQKGIMERIFGKIFGAEARAVENEGAEAGIKDKKIEDRFLLKEFEFMDPDKDGIYSAEVESPNLPGEYEIITVIDYADQREKPKEVRLITVVDPEGYIYRLQGGEETRIRGAQAIIYQLNEAKNEYELWPGQAYGQVNPQTTDETGKYSFLVPEGKYYLTVEAEGYKSYEGKPFEVKEGNGIHENIALMKEFGIKDLFSDWKTLIIFIFGALLSYNFYADRKRKKE